MRNVNASFHYKVPTRNFPQHKSPADSSQVSRPPPQSCYHPPTSTSPTPGTTRPMQVVALVMNDALNPYESPEETGRCNFVDANELTRRMIGTWGMDGQPVLIIREVENQIVLTPAKNSTWRRTIDDAEFIHGSIRFTQTSYLRSGEHHPFNGQLHRYFVRLIDEDCLIFGNCEDESQGDPLYLMPAVAAFESNPWSVASALCLPAVGILLAMDQNIAAGIAVVSFLMLAVISTISIRRGAKTVKKD